MDDTRLIFMSIVAKTSNEEENIEGLKNSGFLFPLFYEVRTK